MPISFACACGREFAVGVEYAGKRTKCPACGAGMTVPAPAAAPVPPKAESEEDAAFRALIDAPDAEPSAAPVRREEVSVGAGAARPPAAPTAPIPAALRGPKLAARSGKTKERSTRPAIHISSGVLGGLASMLVAVVWFVLGLSAGIIYFYPPVLFLFGLVSVVRGLLGHSED
jgi:hypothetical protein